MHVLGRESRKKIIEFLEDKNVNTIAEIHDKKGQQQKQHREPDSLGCPGPSETEKRAMYMKFVSSIKCI